VNANPHELGRVVVSTQGHDRGRRFLVVDLVDERYVLIADGDTRKMSNPKKKKAMHLRAEPAVATETLNAIKAKAQTADSDIRKALAATAPQHGPVPAGAHRKINKEECAFVQK
jgi:large subunit ribosomal protein L14e